jgi:hypothetical protein
MKKESMKSSGKTFQTVIVLTMAMAIAGCAGMMAADNFRKEATAKYVFNVPAEKLLEETAAYLSGGAFGAAMTGGASTSGLDIDREKLTVAGPWKRGKLLRSRTAARITKVDDGHSTLVMNNETQNIDTSKGDWGNSTFSRTTAYEVEMIRRLDKQKAAEIEEGAKKAAAEAKKK